MAIAFMPPGRARIIAGFTLVELAIVLVIIGLIIGGVLTAQQITQNARITSAIQGLKSVQAAVQSYNQNYGALPGDDVQAAERFGGKGLPGNWNGNGSGVIGAVGSYAINQTTLASDDSKESQLVWSHLRAAGLVRGDASQLTPMGNPFGGIYGIQSGAFAAKDFADISVVCLDHAPGNAAQAIDQQLDDGKPDKGAIRGGTAIMTVATQYESGGNYVLCTPLQ